MTVADPAGDAPAAGDRDGLPRRGLRRLAEQGPGLLEGPVPSQSLQPLTPVPSPGNDLLKLRWKPEVRVPCRSATAKRQPTSRRVDVGCRFAALADLRIHAPLTGAAASSFKIFRSRKHPGRGASGREMPPCPAGDKRRA